MTVLFNNFNSHSKLPTVNAYSPNEFIIIDKVFDTYVYCTKSSHCYAMMHVVPKCQKKYSKDVEWDKNNVIEKINESIHDKF